MPVLFAGTVRENILLGKKDATDEEVTNAAKAANAYDFIMNLPDGFNTEVGEGGVFLSGGQRQRITIARAYLKNPKILILDEATNAFDSEPEQQVLNHLQVAARNRTVFFIAHRFAPLKKADLILVMENGVILEQGTHEELLRKEGVYSSLYRLQQANV